MTEPPSATPESTPHISSWRWVPSLYFAQGIPYAVVMLVATVLYKRLGVSNSESAFWISWLALPWVLKPFWSPLVELSRTKRWWVVTMQCVVATALAALAFAIPGTHFFQSTLACFWLIAICSATHDIAADGFYLISIPTSEQALFVGVRSTAFRMALLTGQGLIVILAGLFEQGTGISSSVVTVTSEPGTGSTIAWAEDADIPLRASDLPGIQLSPEALSMDAQAANEAMVTQLIEKARRWNQGHGFSEPDDLGSRRDTSPKLQGWFQTTATRFAAMIRARFAPPPREESARQTGNAVLCWVRYDAPVPPGSHRGVTMRRVAGSPDHHVVEGERALITAENSGQSFAVVIQRDPHAQGSRVTRFRATGGNLARAWSLTFVLLSAAFLALSLYHAWALPHPPADRLRSRDIRSTLSELREAILGFFAKPGIVRIMLYLLLFRFAEGQLTRMAQPFLLDERGIGGLGLSTSQVGTVYGIGGTSMLLLGGILGGALAARDGLGKWFWWMVAAINVPNVVYWLLATYQPTNLGWVIAAVGVEQLGYGFGFASYVLVSMGVARGGRETVHYAFCTGLWALGLMIPGMLSGWLQQLVGYERFFLWVVIATLPSFLVSATLPRSLKSVV